ncbi:type II toxin-antitoxin system RelE/ParE family toxin [Azotobacter armeniacus]
MLEYEQVAYTFSMKAIFVETMSFTATVGDYLTDDEYRQLQRELLKNPEAGDVMPRTGGFRKLRWADGRRGKGKRGGLRVIYYWLLDDGQFWMFAIFDKDELENLTAEQEKLLKQAITAELKKRGAK